MYTAFYELEIKPFQVSSDPTFIWLGEKHKEALAVLRYGILDNKGFLLLTGDVGTGKTTLLNTLVTSLGDDVIYASVPDPRLIKIEFFNYIADAFGITGTFKTKGKFLKAFSTFLIKACHNNKKVLLLIDESQLLTQDLLEEIRLLSNIEMPNRQMLNIFFVGQNEFNEVISRPENRAVAQRLTLNYYLEPLSLHETEQYISHRLKIAGTGKKIFDTAAIREIHSYSGGFPRRINIICDHCLLTGYVKEKKTIDAVIVTDCAKELEIPRYEKPKQKETRPVRIQQPLSMQPAAQAQAQPKPYSPPQSVQYPDFPPAERQSKKSRKILVTLLFAMFFLGLSSFMFPEFFAPYYQKAENYLTPLPDILERIRRESPSPNVAPAVDDKSTETKSTGISAVIAPAPSVEMPEKSSSVGEENREKAMVPMQKEDIQSGNNPVSRNEQAEDTPPVTQPVSSLAKTLPTADAPASSTVSHNSEIKQADRVIIEDAQKSSFLREKLIVRFVHDSNYFNAPDIEKLKEFAKKLIAHPDTMALISGYTDSTGTENYNVKLSEFRANIVRGFLLGQGVPPEQMKSEGRGTQNPIDSNDTTEGRTLNRRVEITVSSR